MAVAANIIISIIISILITLLIWWIQTFTYNNFNYYIPWWLLIIIGVIIAFIVYFLIGVIQKNMMKRKIEKIENVRPVESTLSIDDLNNPINNDYNVIHNNIMSPINDIML